MARRFLCQWGIGGSRRWRVRCWSPIFWHEGEVGAKLGVDLGDILLDFGIIPVHVVEDCLHGDKAAHSLLETPLLQELVLSRLNDFTERSSVASSFYLLSTLKFGNQFLLQLSNTSHYHRIRIKRNRVLLNTQCFRLGQCISIRLPFHKDCARYCRKRLASLEFYHWWHRLLWSKKHVESIRCRLYSFQLLGVDAEELSQAGNEVGHNYTVLAIDVALLILRAGLDKRRNLNVNGRHPAQASFELTVVDAQGSGSKANPCLSLEPEP
mmetsp:Transcript_95512/g.165936  ORF Transcript_95512/g.165936 Transcript_95512/m.165936 type:complete len:267 (-) Transcript_95512:10-810(-)